MLRIYWPALVALCLVAPACGGDEVIPPPSADGGSGGNGGATNSSVSTGEGGTTTAGSGAGAPQIPYPDPSWAEGAPADHGLDPTQLEAAALVAEQNESYCLLVIRHGVLVAEHYWRGHDRDSQSPSWSIAKSYSAVLAGIALDRGDFDSLDQSVADFIPEWKDDPRQDITLRHVLSMTSGLHWSAFDDYVGMATFANDHSKHAIELSSDVAPDNEWTYHNGGVQLLEPVFRSATGMTIEQYAEQHLWSKLGMNAHWARDPSENPTAYASVMASCRDHARLGYLYLHGGRWADTQIIPQSFVEESLTPSQPFNRAYGFLWWLNNQTPAIDAMMEPWPGRMVPFAPKDLFAARGFGNQFIDVIPSLDMIVVRMGTDPMGDFNMVRMFEDQRFERHDAILRPVLDAIVD
jgi:CubicO group peptidase (beta-lactamase class C family)